MDVFTETAQLAARTAGGYLMQHFGQQITSSDKESHHSIVTEHDVEAERIIVQGIQNSFPGHSILSEEMGLQKADSDYLWVIDPLDGSSYYSRGIEMFSVAVALLKENQVIAGAIYNPVRSEMFYAWKDGGAFLNGTPITVSPHTNLKETICTAGHRYLRLEQYDQGMRNLLKSVRSIRGGGSCAQEMCYLACGRIDVLLTVNQSFWDYAAGSLIVREAGGQVSDITGVDFDVQKHLYGKFDLLATNGHVHKQVLGLVCS